jgi:hypothetical protein
MGRKGLISAGVLCAFAGLALAAPPAVVDRVPSNAAGVIMVRDVSESIGRIKHIIDMFPKNEGDENGMQEVEQMLDTPGFNKTGSAAMVMLPGADGTVSKGDKPEMMAIVPVSDYKAFVGTFGGNASDKVTKVEFKPGEEKFMRDIGGGYAIVADSQATAEGFEGKGGQTEAHAKLLGKVGGRIVDEANVVAVGNVKALRPVIQEAITGVKDQGEMVAMMAGGNPQVGNGAAGGIAVITTLMEGFEKDGQAGVIGINISDAGIALDVGAQFADGSEVSKFFSEGGNSARLMKNVPNQPFYFAGAVDSGNPGLKQLMKNAAKQTADAVAEANKKSAENSGEAAPAEAAPSPFGAFTSDLDNQTGVAFSMGQSPALMGGIFLKTTTYMEGKDPEKMLTNYRSNLKKADGVKSGPVTTKVTYTEGASKVGDTSVDSWKMSINVDPGDPSAAQAKQAMAMIFGPGGPGGLTAQTKKGLVSIMGNDSAFMGTAIDAANGGKNQSEDELFSAAAGHLPKNRTAEFYIGVKPIMETVTGFMAMMGGGGNFQVPEKMSPIAIGATTDNGGTDFRIFVPKDVIESLASMAKSMKEAEQPPADAPAEKDDTSKSPRF